LQIWYKFQIYIKFKFCQEWGVKLVTFTAPTCTTKQMSWELEYDNNIILPFFLVLIIMWQKNYETANSAYIFTFLLSNKDLQANKNFPSVPISKCFPFSYLFIWLNSWQARLIRKPKHLCDKLCFHFQCFINKELTMKLENNYSTLINRP
jgi:hypothetical protein